MSSLGKHWKLSEETKAKMRGPRTPLTEEHKRVISNTLKGVVPWNKGRKGHQRNHSFVGLTGFNGKPAWNRGMKGFMAGEKNGNWIKDRTMVVKKQERNDPAYKAWRIEIYRRDVFKCRIDNRDCFGRIIAHHILGWSFRPELRYEVNNGITLCLAHHPRKRAEEKRLVPTFQELVSVSSE